MKRFAVAIVASAIVNCTLPATETQQPVAVRVVAFSADGSLLAAGFGDKDVAGGLLIWNVAEGRAVRVVRSDRGVSSVAFSSDGARVALSEIDCPPRVVDLSTGDVVVTLAEPCRGTVVFSPDGSTLACGASDKTIHVWDVKSQTDRRVLSGAKDRVYGRMVYSPDGTSLLTPCGTAGVYLWNLSSGDPRQVLKHGESFTRSALISPDSRWIVTGGWDGTTRTWDAATGKERARLSGMGSVNSLDLSPTSNLLAVGCGNEIRLFELSLAEPAAEDLAQIRSLVARFEDDSYAVRESASAELVKLGFRAEAELMRAASESPLAEVRIRTRRARQAILTRSLASLLGHQDNVWSVGFSPDGKLLASASNDGTVRLWNVADRMEIACFVPSEARLHP